MKWNIFCYNKEGNIRKLEFGNENWELSIREVRVSGISQKVNAAVFQCVLIINVLVICRFSGEEFVHHLCHGGNFPVGKMRLKLISSMVDVASLSLKFCAPL